MSRWTRTLSSIFLFVLIGSFSISTVSLASDFELSDSDDDDRFEKPKNPGFHDRIPTFPIELAYKFNKQERSSGKGNVLKKKKRIRVGRFSRIPLSDFSSLQEIKKEEKKRANLKKFVRSKHSRTLTDIFETETSDVDKKARRQAYETIRDKITFDFRQVFRPDFLFYLENEKKKTVNDRKGWTLNKYKKLPYNQLCTMMAAILKEKYTTEWFQFNHYKRVPLMGELAKSIGYRLDNLKDTTDIWACFYFATYVAEFEQNLKRVLSLSETPKKPKPNLLSKLFSKEKQNKETLKTILKMMGNLNKLNDQQITKFLKKQIKQTAEKKLTFEKFKKLYPKKPDAFVRATHEGVVQAYTEASNTFRTIFKELFPFLKDTKWKGAYYLQLCTLVKKVTKIKFHADGLRSVISGSLLSQMKLKVVELEEVTGEKLDINTQQRNFFTYVLFETLWGAKKSKKLKDGLSMLSQEINDEFMKKQEELKNQTEQFLEEANVLGNKIKKEGGEIIKKATNFVVNKVKEQFTKEKITENFIEAVDEAFNFFGEVLG